MTTFLERIRKPQHRGVTRSVVKLGTLESGIFKDVLWALMAQVPCPRAARKSYMSEVTKRIQLNGVGFLSACRPFPMYGAKLLGKDYTGFPVVGLARSPGKIYPKLFGWYWGELVRLSSISNPTKSDALRARKVLSVLSFAKMIRMSSVKQVAKALSAFETRVTNDDSVPQGGSIPFLEPELDKNLAPNFFNVLGVNSQGFSDLPATIDLGNLSMKASALKQQPPMFPEYFRNLFYESVFRSITGCSMSLFKNCGKVLSIQGNEPDYRFKKGPYGKTCVLTENGGKLRVILPYNTPFVHSTGLYTRCRFILDRTNEDVSHDQAIGHRYLKKISKLGLQMVSADLSAFTDSIRTRALDYGLSCLDISMVGRYLFNLPVENIRGDVFVPKKLLMGLKGCFELSSVMHHYAVKIRGIKDYVMCGDDMLFLGNLEDYQESLKIIGCPLNRTKTLISKSVGVFCGEYYWRGHCIKPVTVKVNSLFLNGKVNCSATMFSAVRDMVNILSEVYGQKTMFKIMRPILGLLGKSWKGSLFPELPQKLRGLGIRIGPTRPLLSLLKGKRAKCARLSIGFLKEVKETQRWLDIPINFQPYKEPLLVLPFLPTLLKGGGINLRSPPPLKKRRKDHRVPKIYDVLEWYYNSTRICRDIFLVPL